MLLLVKNIVGGGFSFGWNGVGGRRVKFSSVAILNQKIMTYKFERIGKNIMYNDKLFKTERGTIFCTFSYQ